MLDQLVKLDQFQSYSICPENPTGERNKGASALTGTGAFFSRKLGPGFKMSPSVEIPAGEAWVLGKIQGEGKITHIWLTCPESAWRDLILECTWDNEKEPSVQVPVGDFFCNGWCQPSLVNSLPIVVAPKGGFNSYWEMPFVEGAKLVLRNLYHKSCIVYYQIDYCLGKLEGIPARFHAQFRRTNPTKKGEPHVILDNVFGRGHYVGTYLAWQSNSCDWWGEGEMKFYLDEDKEYPSICSTGTEDYFGGAYNFEQPHGNYCGYSTPFLGLSQIIRPDGLYSSQQRFGMYRWHIQDRIRFQEKIRVSIQPLGVRCDSQYLCLQEDIASTAYWYQEEPHETFPTLPDEEGRYVTRKIDWEEE